MNRFLQSCQEISGTTDVWCPGSNPADLAATGGFDIMPILIAAAGTAGLGAALLIIYRVREGHWPW